MGTRAQSQEWIQRCLTGNVARVLPSYHGLPLTCRHLQDLTAMRPVQGTWPSSASLSSSPARPPRPAAHWASWASLFLVALFWTPLQFIPLLRSPLSSEFPISSLHTIFCQSEPFTPQPNHLLLLKTLPCWSIALKTKSRWLLNQPLRPGVHWPSPPPQPHWTLSPALCSSQLCILHFKDAVSFPPTEPASEFLPLCPAPCTGWAHVCTPGNRAPGSSPLKHSA